MVLRGDGGGGNGLLALTSDEVVDRLIRMELSYICCITTIGNELHWGHRYYVSSI